MILHASQNTCPAGRYIPGAETAQKGGTSISDASRRCVVGPIRSMVSHRYFGLDMLARPNGFDELPRALEQASPVLSACAQVAILKRVDNDDLSTPISRCIICSACFRSSRINRDETYPHIHKLLVSLSPQTPHTHSATTIILPTRIDFYLWQSDFSG